MAKRRLVRRGNKKRSGAFTESEAQQALITWARLNKLNYPGVHLLYKNANEGKRPLLQVNRFKLEGLQRGVPDLFLPVPLGKYHGLYIEMKSSLNGKLTESQEYWLKELNKKGYCARVCFGSEQAINLIKEYYGQGNTNNP